MLLSYLRLFPLLAGLLFAVQVPTFVDRYQLVVDAHLSEAERNFSGFRELAGKYFAGDIQQLIVRHRNSDDPLFRDEGQVIEALYLRIQWLKGEAAAVRGPRIEAFWHLLQQGRGALVEETWRNYQAVVPLNQEALVWGAAGGLLAAACLELLLLAGTGWRRRRRRASLLLS